jgi:hypothetical protein
MSNSERDHERELYDLQLRRMKEQLSQIPPSEVPIPVATELPPQLQGQIPMFHETNIPSVAEAPESGEE